MEVASPPIEKYRCRHIPYEVDVVFGRVSDKNEVTSQSLFALIFLNIVLNMQDTLVRDEGTELKKERRTTSMTAHEKSDSYRKPELEEVAYQKTVWFN